MGAVKDYINSLTGAEKAAVDRVYSIAKQLVPEAEEGTKYAMAALVYKNKGLISTVAYKDHLSIFPFSGSILGVVADKLEGFKYSKGTLHYHVDKQVPEEVIAEIVNLSKLSIDGKDKK